MKFAALRKSCPALNLLSRQLGYFQQNVAGGGKEKSTGLFRFLVSWLSRGHMTRKREMVRSLFSPQGPLPHEANMQFHLPNLRCKNRTQSRDAHRQKDRLLHKGSFYVEGPWSTALCSSGLSLCRSQGHCMVIKTWITKAVEGLNHTSHWK